MEFIGKLASSDTSDSAIIPSASRDVFIIFVKHYIQIINDKNRFNGIKICTRMQKKE